MSSLPGAANFDAKAPKWAETLTVGSSTDGVTIVTPMNFTGYTLTLRVKFATGTVSYSTAQGVTGNSSGVVSWILDISAWVVGPVDYDLCAVAADGTPVWLIAGTVSVTS